MNIYSSIIVCIHHYYRSCPLLVYGRAITINVCNICMTWRDITIWGLFDPQLQNLVILSWNPIANQKIQFFIKLLVNIGEQLIQKGQNWQSGSTKRTTVPLYLEISLRYLYFDRGMTLTLFMCNRNSCEFLMSWQHWETRINPALYTLILGFMSTSLRESSSSWLVWFS